MTKEELKKEAEKWLCNNLHSASEEDFIKAMVEFAEPREKRIAELEKENAELRNLKDVADLIRLNNSSVVTMAQLNNNNVALRKENAELRKEWQEQVQKATDEGYARTLQTIQLTKAKEIIKELLSSCFGYNSKTVNYEIKAEAEQFLSEVEK
jgi:trans-2-enoyl-CoA reductase